MATARPSLRRPRSGSTTGQHLATARTRSLGPPIFQRVTPRLPAFSTPCPLPIAFSRLIARHFSSALPPPVAPGSSSAPSGGSAEPPPPELRMQRLHEVLASLDPFQSSVVDATSRQLLTLGIAGSGKSYCIGVRVASLIKGGEESAQMLVLSMSDGQAKGMRNFVDIIAPLSTNEAEFTSLSSFVSRTTRDYASELSGLSIDSARFCNKQEMEDFARTHFHLLGFERYAGATSKGQFLLAFLSTVRTLEDQGFSAEKWQALIRERRRTTHRNDYEEIDDLNAQEEVARACERFVGLKQRFNVYDLSQQPTILLDALEQRPRIIQDLRQRYKRLFVDDLQNASLPQLRLLRRIWGDSSVFFTVDENQALASNGTLIRVSDVAELFPQMHMSPLRVSHRCSSSLISSARTLVSLNAKRAALLLNLAPVTSDNKLSVEPAVEHLRYTTLHEEESGLVSKITELVKSDKLNLKDLAILTRTRTEGLRLQQRLTQSNIPCRFIGEQRASDSPELAFLVSFLSAILHPADDRAIYAVLQSPVYNLPPADLSMLTAASVRTRKALRVVLEEAQHMKPGLSVAGLTGLSTMLHDLNKYEKLFPMVKTSALVQEYLKDKGLLETYLKPETLAIETQSRFIANFLSRLEQAEPALRSDRHNGLMLFLSRLSAADDISEAEDAVQLMTVHKAKAANLEAEVVFLAGAVEGRFPGQWSRPELSFQLPFGSTQLTRDEFIAEERNLVYVAMTRARRRFFFASANSYPLTGSHLWPQSSPASRFIAEALGFDADDVRKAASAPFPISRTALPAPPPLPLSSAAQKANIDAKRTDVGAAFALSATDTAMARENGIGPLTFDRWHTYSVCPLRYCFRYVHNISGASLQSDVLLNSLVQQSAEDLLLAARAALNVPAPEPTGAVREYLVEGTKELVAVDVIETAFVRRLQQASAPLGQSALPQSLIVEGIDMVRRFATRESAFLMGTAKSVLSGDSISFELPLLSEPSRSVLVEQPWESAVEGPEGIVLYTTEKLSRRSAELTQRGTWMSVALQHCKPGSGPFVEWRSIAKGTVQKSKVSGKAKLAAEAGIVQAAEGIASGRFEARPTKTNCGSCLYRDTCPSAYRARPKV